MRLTPDTLRSFVVEHTMMPLAARSALAAVGAWLAVIPFGGLADDYPYYAPLGAVVAVSTTVLSSIRSAGQTVAAIAAGAALGIAAHLVSVPTPVGIGVVVGLGTLVGGLRWLGTLGGWVPISAMFVLIIGEGSPWHYGLGYLLLTGFGALIGTAVSLALPPLLLAETVRAQEQLRDELVRQLDELADGLDGTELPTAEEWRSRRRDVEPHARHVRDLVGRAIDAPRLNWRVRRWRRRADALASQGRALAGLAFQVGDLTDLIAFREHADRGDHPLGPTLRPPAAAALRETAAALRTVGGAAAAPGELADALRAVDRLIEEIRSLRSRTGDDLFVAGALVASLRSELMSVKPEPDGSEAADAQSRSS